MAKSKHGYMKCEGAKCINGAAGAGRVVVMKNEKGTLSYSCQECGRAPYARPGTEQYSDWSEALTPAAPAARESPPPAPAPEKKPAPTPAAKPKPATTLLG